MNAVTGLPFRATSSAKVLILGSMPGAASLAAGEYYAHPRNHFWPIVSAIFHLDASQPYELRMQGLNRAGIALWDVLHSCVRPGSLDNNIVAESQFVNDFAGFIASHPDIALICFNGAKAETVYTQKVSGIRKHIPSVRLPSTSPAHASMSFQDKLSAWRRALAGI
ncbi:MAG TPA: DNA-deoxyinosine glycosylase [Steroidobacteraceae bacterium]|nr:DNA-deoxyinosine glycosylase [Steroidobacteraceae bacterium]